MISVRIISRVGGLRDGLLVRSVQRILRSRLPQGAVCSDEQDVSIVQPLEMKHGGFLLRKKMTSLAHRTRHLVVRASLGRASAKKIDQSQIVKNHRHAQGGRGSRRVGPRRSTVRCRRAAAAAGGRPLGRTLMRQAAEASQRAVADALEELTVGCSAASRVYRRRGGRACSSSMTVIIRSSLPRRSPA